MIFKEKQKSQPISKRQVWDAFKAVKSNDGSAGIDNIDIVDNHIGLLDLGHAIIGKDGYLIAEVFDHLEGHATVDQQEDEQQTESQTETSSDFHVLKHLSLLYLISGNMGIRQTAEVSADGMFLIGE